MVTLAVSRQPLGAVPITWYCVVVVGVAVTLVPVTALNPVAGDHANVEPAIVADAVNTVLLPLQILASEAVTVTLLAGRTVAATTGVVSLVLLYINTQE